jgi:AcrR family transcriptional regulator
MARRSDHTREELKEMAIQAGVQLIESVGFKAFSARQVATRIGYTIGTIYNVFGTHDNLMLNINATTLDRWFEGMEGAVTANGVEGLIQMARYYIRFSREHSGIWTALFEHHMEKDAGLPDWYQAKMQRFFALVARLVMPLMGGDPHRAVSASHILWSGIHGIAILSLSGKLELVGTEAAETLAERFIRDYVRGVTAHTE